MTYLGAVDLSSLTTGGVFTRSSTQPAIFIGDVKTNALNNLSMVVQSTLERLTTPAGAVPIKNPELGQAGTALTH